MSAPFKVVKVEDGHWWLTSPQHWGSGRHLRFSTPGEAIDYAYKNWPWWP